MPRVIASTLIYLSLALGMTPAFAAPRERTTVCTITVNSADEKETLQRQLPPDRYRFVELVERGRADWLESACRQDVRCDVLVISGHYDGGNEFFSDRTEAREFLPVDEMERVACGTSCAGLFAQLKEVYLFGCNTLNAEPTRTPSGEITRSLARAGLGRGDAERATSALGARHGESSRDRMRQIFKDVPAIYGFSSVAPLGPAAGALLNRTLQGGPGEFATGRPNARLLGAFSAHAMTVTSGMRDTDPQAAHRRDICQFADDGLPAERRAAFVHGLLRRDMAEVRMFIDRLERFATNSKGAEDARALDALGAIARDDVARARYLEFARDADLASTRSRMLGIARDLGWLSAEDYRAELVLMFNGQLASASTAASDVDLACKLNRDGELDREFDRLESPPAGMERAAHTAILACLGSDAARTRTLHALTSADEQEATIAQVYLRNRPLDDEIELRGVTEQVIRMPPSPAQVRALHALAGHRFSDPATLEHLTRLFPKAGSVGVQTAIAEILLRADYRAVASPEFVRSLQEHRLKAATDAPDMIDVLLRRLQAD